MNQATKAAQDDWEFIVDNEFSRKGGVIYNLKRVFHEADSTKTGSITWRELKNHLNDSKVRAYFKSLDLEPWDLHTFFQLLDKGSMFHKALTTHF